jgi:tetratricopeptide (TPR) repeat protein
MRTGIGLAAGIAGLVVAFAATANAQTSQEIDACNGKINAAPDLQVSGCTAMLKSGKYTGKNLAIVYNNRCSGNNRKGAQDAAIADCNQAIKLDPGYATPYYNLGIIYYNKNDYDRAIQDSTEAIKRDPAKVAAYTTRANAYSDKGDHDHAILDYNAALRINPKDPVTLNNRCDEFGLLAQFLAARLDCDEALRIRPNHNNTLRHRGLVLLALGKFDEALVDYTNLTQQNPKDADSLFGRGSAKLKKGDVAGGNDDIAAAKAMKADVEKTFWRYGAPAAKP